MLQNANIINYNNIKKEILFDKKNTIVIFDFDYTITTSNSETSIGVFTNYLPIKYKKKKKILDNLTLKAKSKISYYILWKYKLKLLSKYYSKELLNQIPYKKSFKLNKNIKKLIIELAKNDIPTIIYSSGMYDVIKSVLEENKIFFNNIKIISNLIDLKTKKISKNIITPKKAKLKNINYKNIFVFGDKMNDLKIIKNATNILVTDNEFKEVISD